MEFYALWEQNTPTGETDLMFARSLRFGRKFDKPVRVTDKVQPSQNRFSYMTVAPNGDLYAVWLDGRDPQHTAPGTSHVYLTKSTDQGTTWSKNMPVANNVCPCCRTTIAFRAGGAVFVAWRNVDGGDVRDVVDLRSWVFRVAHNLAINQQKGRQRLETLDARAWERLCELRLDPAPNPEQRLLRVEKFERLHAAIARLSPQERQCLHLRAEGLRYREIAEILGLSTATVAKSLYRAINQLKEGQLKERSNG